MIETLPSPAVVTAGLGLLALASFLVQSAKGGLRGEESGFRETPSDVALDEFGISDASKGVDCDYRASRQIVEKVLSAPSNKRSEDN